MKFIFLTLILVAASLSQALAQNTAPMSKDVHPGADPVSMGKTTDNRQTLTDSQIAAIVKTANDADIKGGKFAEKKAQRSDVKAFAKEMIKDHGKANDKLAKLLKKDNMEKTPNDTSKGMEKNCMMTMDHLKSVKKEDFDREYMDSELAMHQQVLDSIDNDLMPNAKNEDLKNFLKEVRPIIANHLEKAKKIQTAMNSNQ